MKAKRIAAVALGLMMALMPVSGAYASDTTEALRNEANTDPANTVKTDEQIIIEIPSEPAYAFGIPAGNLGKDNVMLQSLYLDTLVTRDPVSGEILPSLATEWKWLDETHLQLTLRDDVIMADGSALTANDVLYTAKCWTDFNSTNDAGKYFNYAECSVVDDHTVILGLNVVAPDFVGMLSWHEFGIISESAVEAVGGLDAASGNPVIGSGKYIFKEWKRGEEMVFERNEDYWDDGYAGYFKEIRFHFVSDASSRQMSILSGDADVAYEIPVTQAKSMESVDNVKTWIYSVGSVFHMFYNIGNDGPLSDIRVRQAVDKALNFDALAAVGTGGYGTKSLGYIDESCYLHTDIWTEEEKAVDIEGAKQLLEDAGYGDGLALEAVILQEQMPTWVVIQENLRAVGIELTINNADVSSYVEDAITGNYDLILIDQYIDGRNPDIFTFFTWKSVIDGFLGGDKWTTDELDTLITKAISETDDAAAKEYVVQIEQYLKEYMLETDTYPCMYGMITAEDIMGLTINNKGMMSPAYFYRAE